MGLPIINSVGIEAYCSDLIVDEDSEIYFLSVAGYQTAVKGIIANVLEYNSVTVRIDGEFQYPLRSIESYSIQYQKLPSGLFQGVILPRIAFPNNDETKDMFLVLAEGGSTARELFYKHLDEKTDVPLHPLWSDWLWKVFLDKAWLTPLECLIGDCEGYLVEINEDELRHTITTAIAHNKAEVIMCFEKGGENGRDEQS